MKKITKILFVCFASFLISKAALSQNISPVWTYSINSLPDTVASLRPVQFLSDAQGNIIVLSRYNDQSNVDSSVYKTCVKKLSSNGALIWTYIYESSNPRPYKMVLDGQGNAYVAGTLNIEPSVQAFLIKINSIGSLVWERVGTTLFSVGLFDQIILSNNNLFLGSYSGMAKFDLNGNEIWSNTNTALAMVVDNLGRIIYSGYDTLNNTIFRINQDGVINFSDASISAQKLVVDSENSFYLFSSTFPEYELVKYDSLGQEQWTYSNFPQALPFGDIGMELSVDNSNNLWVIGLSDTIFKFSSNGNLIWQKSMHNTDNYLIAKQSVEQDALFVLGSTQSFGGYDHKVVLFNSNGNLSYSNTYNGTDDGQEFAVDLIVNADGLYVLGNVENNTEVIKFPNPISFNSIVDFSSICVDSVWYDTENPNSLNISLFNGSLGFINYPYIGVVAPNGDTISLNSEADFFGQAFNTFLTYAVEVSELNITDFQNFNFILNIAFPDTAVTIDFCIITKIKTESVFLVSCYPNPSKDIITFTCNSNTNNFYVNLFNGLGQTISTRQSKNQQSISIDINSLSKGIYFYRGTQNNKTYFGKFIKE